MTSLQCGGSALIWFLCSGWKILVFGVRIEITRIFVSGHRNRLDIRVGIKIDLISVMRSKFTSFLCEGSKLTWFSRRDRTWLLFCAVVKIGFGFVFGLRIGYYYLMDRNWLVFLSWGSKLTWFWCAGRKWVVFSIGTVDLIFVRVVEICMVFVSWPKLTWFYCEHRN